MTKGVAVGQGAKVVRLSLKAKKPTPMQLMDIITAGAEEMKPWLDEKVAELLRKAKGG